MQQSRLCAVRSILIAAVVASFPFGAGAKSYKSAEIFTNNSQLYGKYVMRIRAAKGSGVISNFFLWKEGSELSDVFWEEVDIEIFGKDNAQSWQSNIITGLNTRITSEQVHTAASSFADAYHTFSIEWTPGQVRWLVDGNVIRTTTGGQADDLVSPSQMRFNFWPPNVPEWVGSWNDSILPVYMFVNWVEYHSWNGAGFDLEWRDDFNSFDTTRWGKANWTFDENRADFVPDNAVTRDGYLVLALTYEGAEGYTGTPPADDDSPPSPGGDLICTAGNVDTWSTGFVLNNFTVTNNGSSSVSGWSVSLSFDQLVSITNAWGISISGSGSSFTGTNVDHNGNLAPGQSASFGMQGTSSSPIGMPSCTVD
jgi:hypothetical protein